MNEQEAIELLDNLDGMIEDNHGIDYDTAFKMAIKALEKQIPKKPVICDGFMTVARCPVCNEVLPIPAKHCNECGQKLDWAVEE